MNDHFFDLTHYGDRPALVCPDQTTYTYSQLAALCDGFSAFLGGGKKLVFVLCVNGYEAIVGYLGCLRSGHVPLLLDARVETDFLSVLMEKYNPDFLWAPGREEDSVYALGGYSLRKLKKQATGVALHPDLALLLSTSGSTGSPKLVRLSARGLQANAEAICQYLNITENERPVTVLPMQYTYGLSVINSHLNRGAAILVTDDSIMQSSFWEFAKSNGVTSLCGVPYTYQMYRRLRIFQMDLPGLKTMTQAGGKLPAALGQEFSQQCAAKDISFFIMYGQTEATARMAYLPTDRVADKFTSIGVAIPGGKFSLIDSDGGPVTEPETVGELVYQGPNVMMGYAQSERDLSLGDEMGGRLVTGDMAKFDAEGFYYIVGRKKRFVKLFGNRINLDEMEQHLKAQGFDCACVGVDDRMTVFVTREGLDKEIKALLTAATHINATAFSVRYIEAVPRNESGKVLYSVLNEVK